MPVEHTYVVLLSTDEEAREEPEAFGPFEHYDEATEYAAKLKADGPYYWSTLVLPVKPAE